MPNKEFLENYPLFKKLKLQVPEYFSELNRPPINMECPICDSAQTFAMSANYFNYHPAPTSNQKISIKYYCQACLTFERQFQIYISSKRDFIYKFGQFPEWEIEIDKRLEKTLGKHSKMYKNGLVCESQGYGIGAFSYYRRITEEIIDQLLNSLTELLEPPQRKKYEEALEKTRKTTVTSDKIELVKDLLPQSLRPGNMNPLSILHSELSKGLHDQSDADCLESAGNIRKILSYLVKRITEGEKDNLDFTDGMRAFLDKKSRK